MKNLNLRISIALIVLLIVSLACSSTTEKLEEASQASTQAPSQQEQVKPTSSDPETTKAPTKTPKPQPSPTPKAEDVQLLGEPAFVQSSIEVKVIFIVQNPNESMAINDSQCQATIFDEAGTVLGTTTEYMEVILPGENFPVVASIFVDEGQKPAKAEVSLISGTAEETDLRPPLFTAEQVTFVADEYLPKVTAVLVNSFKRSFEDLKVVAVAYDKEEKIIGGGYTYLNFLPGDSQTGVDVSVDTLGTPERVEITATVSSLSMLREDNSQNESVTLVDYGWSQTRRTVSVGFTAISTNETQVIENTQFRITAYDEAGVVLDTDEGYLNYIFPAEQTAGSADLYLPEGAVASKVEVYINPGSPSTYFLTSNPFSVENVNFVEGSYMAKVTGILKNSHADKISTTEVVAIGYDQDGKIIGGGFTFIDLVPGNGQTAFEISVEFGQKPDKVEVYPMLSSLSTIGD